jgi:hypothetical protein
VGIESRRYSPAYTEEEPMKQICLAAVSGAALLALASFAHAQKSGIGAPPLTGSGASGAAANQCWDVSANIVRDKSAAAGATSGGTADRAGTTGAAASGAGSAGSASGSPPGAAAAARPAGMPNC